MPLMTNGKEVKGKMQLLERRVDFKVTTDLILQ